MKKGTRLLISYHSNDGRWKDVFDRHCEPYRENGELEVVYDEISSRGVHFNQPIDENIPLFDVVFLIISKDYLALDMVSNGNIEQLLTTFDNHNVKIVLVHAEHCEWQKHEWIIKRGLWPNNSNALADDWGYEERLNRLVSELIKDLIAEKRDIDLTINQQKGRFGDNRDKNHLREKFMAFLLKEKGCLNPSLHMDNSDIIVGVGKRCGLEIIGEGETLAVIEFGMSENDSVISSASKIFQPYMNYKTSAKIKFYLVLPYVSGLGEEFDIHEFDMITHEEVGIFCKDFPKYEDLIWKVTGKVVKGGNVENKNFQTIFDEAQDAFNKSDFDRAIQLFDDAIKLNQYDTASWVLLARALSKVGKQDQAFTCFDTALQFAKNKSYVLLYKGTVYRDIGNRVAEFDCYDRAIENDPTYIQTYMQKAHVLQQEGNHEGAIECFKKGPENDLKPDREALLWHSLAAAYIPIGRLEEAYKSINRSLDLNDNEFTRRIKRLIIDEMSQKGLIDDGDIKIEVPDVWQLAFIAFLEKEKGYPLNTFIWSHKEDYDLSIIDNISRDLLAIIDFKRLKQKSSLVKVSSNLRFHMQSVIAGYIVCPSQDELSESFEIYEVKDNGYESILVGDFPAVDKLRKRIKPQPDEEPFGVDNTGKNLTVNINGGAKLYHLAGG